MSEEPDGTFNSQIREQSSIDPVSAPEELIPIDQVQKDSTAESSTTTPQLNEHELLAEQFDNYLRISQSLMKTLKRPKDIEICSDLMRKVKRLNESKHLEVKRNNNRFFRYCLKILNWTSVNQPMEYYQHWYNHSTEPTIESVAESHTWLEENKSYSALTSLKDGTLIIYTAVSTYPDAGWQEKGLNILAKRGACIKN